MRRACALLFTCLYFVLLASPLGAPAGAAPACADVVLYGVRGSGETNADAGGYGETIAQYKQLIENRLRGKRSLRSVFVDYPSRPVSDFLTDSGRFFDGVGTGVDRLLARVKEGLDACPAERIVLAGYSQGALVLNFAMGSLASDSRARTKIATMDLFADPLMYGRSVTRRGDADVNKNGIYQIATPITSETVNDTFRSRVRSWCNFNDPVCSYSKANLILHQDVHVNSYKNLSALIAGNAAADVLLSDYKEPSAPSGSGGPTDVMFAIDTTGSMGDDIGSVKMQATTILDGLKAGSSSARAGLVVYKDQGDEYVAKTLAPLTGDLASVNEVIQSLTVGGGGDFPEAVNSGVITAIRQGWRNGVKKAVILMGDAPGKNPEPITGYTIDDVKRESLAVDPAIVYPIATKPVPETEEYFQTLASATGGALFTVSSGDVAAAVTAAISEISASPTAVLTVDQAPSGGTTTFSASQSTPSSTAISKYEWDLDGDGTYELTTEAPTTEKVYTGPVDLTAGLRVTDAAGRSGLATASIKVDGPTPLPPFTEAITPLVIGDSCGQLLKWPAPPTPDGFRWSYTIVDADGRTVGTVEDGSTSWRVPADRDARLLRVLPTATPAGSESAPNDVSCTIAEMRDRLEISVTGGQTYSNFADVTSGQLSIVRESNGLLRSVDGDVKLASPSGSTATVSLFVRHVSRWDVGFIRIVDKTAGIDIIATILLTPALTVQGDPPESVATLRGRGLQFNGKRPVWSTVVVRVTDRGI